MLIIDSSATVFRAWFAESGFVPTAMEAEQNDGNTNEKANSPSGQTLSKNAQKKLLKQQRFEAKKAEKKALMKEQKKREAERKKKEWEERLASLGSEEERQKLIESRKALRKERMDKRSEEKEKKMERLNKAKESGQNIVIDLEFAHLMSSTELNSLLQQVQNSFFFFWFTNYYKEYLFSFL